MDREQLVGHGYIVGRGLLQARRGELGVPLLAGRKASKLTKDGHLRLSSAWQSNCAVRGGLGCMLGTRGWASWARGVSCQRRR